ncbi:MAG: hypothetical protein E6Q89_02110 [Bacteroidia bacterium]|nr:MAG: hypothetical protein E6Q89_02110 [Bacteroidia bacterium]
MYIGSSTKPIKRFFLEDTYTNPTYMNILNDFKLTFALNSTGYLLSPTLKLAYKKLSIQGSKVTPTIDKDQSITYQIKFVYDLQTFWPAFIGIFIAINVIVLIQSLIRTYIAYLNKQSVLNFFYYLMNFWSIWIFYFLIAISGYWFFFCKTTQDVYIFIPDSGTDVFYVAFFIIAGVMGLFRVITVFIDKQFKLNY